MRKKVFLIMTAFILFMGSQNVMAASSVSLPSETSNEDVKEDTMKLQSRSCSIFTSGRDAGVRVSGFTGNVRVSMTMSGPSSFRVILTSIRNGTHYAGSSSWDGEPNGRYTVSASAVDASGTSVYCGSTVVNR